MRYKGLKRLEKISDASQEIYNVYFCGVPLDYEICFETITNEVAELKANIVFNYLEKPASDFDGEDKEKFLSDLKEMQLFVVPLSYAFLKSDNRARLLDFKFAVDNGIPVLLLAVEEELDKRVPDISERVFYMRCFDKYRNPDTYKEDVREFITRALSDSSSKGEDGQLEILGKLALSLCIRGSEFSMNREFANARESFEKALRIRTEIANKTKTIEAYKDLAFVYIFLGQVAEDEGDLTIAQKHYENSFSINANIVKKSKTPETLGNLALSYAYLGYLAKAQGDLNKSKEYCELVLNAREQITRQHFSIDNLESICATLTCLADIAKEEGDLSAEKSYVEKCLAVRSKIYDKTNKPEDRRSYAINKSRLGHIYKREGDVLRAKECYEETLDIDRQNYEKNKSKVNLSNLYIALHNMGDISLLEGDYEASREYYEEEVKLILSLPIPNKRHLKVAYDALIYLLEIMGDYEAAQEYRRKLDGND